MDVSSSSVPLASAIESWEVIPKNEACFFSFIWLTASIRQKRSKAELGGGSEETETQSVLAYQEATMDMQ